MSYYAKANNLSKTSEEKPIRNGDGFSPIGHITNHGPNLSGHELAVLCKRISDCLITRARKSDLAINCAERTDV